MSSFGGSVKLTGESEYRKALKEISSNLKVLNSEMKVVTSQYDKNDQSAENLSQQSGVLNKQLAEQQKKVDVLTQALENSKKETGENSDKTKKWQVELNNAQADLNKLNKDLNNNTNAMEDAVRVTMKEADAVEDFGEEAEKSGKSALSLGDIIKANLISDAIKGGLQALANGVKAVGGAMTECLTAGASYADNLLTLSAQTGLSTDTLEKYNAVAELTDVSLDTLTNSMAKNIKSMSDARDGSKAYAEAYEKLGVKVADNNGNLRDSETVYWETIDALKGISDETERDALAMEIFGKKSQDLNTIIALGSEGVKEYTDKAESMGAVLGGKGLEALGNLDDQMQIFKTSTSSTKNILASAFAPAMSNAMGGVNDLVGAFNGLVSAVISGEGVDQALNIVSEGITNLITGIEEALPQILEVVGDLFGMVLNLIGQYLPLLIQEGAEMLASLLSGITSNIGSVTSAVLGVVNTLLNTVLANLPTIIEMGCQMLVALVQGIADMLPTLIPTVIDAVILMAMTLLDNIDLIIDAGINLISALADGLLEALPELIDKIPVIIEKLINAIVNNLPKILEAGIKIVIKLAEGLIKAVPQLVSKIPQIITSIVSGLKSGLSKIGSVGLDLVKGLWNGIKDATGWIMDKIKGFGSSILNGIKDFFGIHSPSTVFKDEIGKNLALGVGEGFADTMKDISADMQGAIPTEFDADISTSIGAVSSQQPSTYEMMVVAFKQALKEVKIVLDDREMGNFVTNKVERVVFA